MLPDVVVNPSYLGRDAVLTLQFQLTQRIAVRSSDVLLEARDVGLQHGRDIGAVVFVLQCVFRSVLRRVAFILLLKLLHELFVRFDLFDRLGQNQVVDVLLLLGERHLRHRLDDRRQ
ncbi:hypothetical protein D3C87_1407140 [compost metagenome]